MGILSGGMMQDLRGTTDEGGSIRIVLVDDSTADLELMERELEDFGLRVEALRARGLGEVESLFRDQPPDLVITDYVLPDGDGLGVLATVRERDPLIPVIVITGAVDERTASACIGAGAADYVLKDHLPRLPIAVLNALEKVRVRSEALRAQEALRESESRYRLLVESLPVVAFTLAVEPYPHLTFVSSRVEAVLGIPRSRWLENPDFLGSRIHPQDRSTVLRGLVRGRRSGSLQDLTFRILGREDRVHWVRINASATANGGGRAVLQGVLRDITDLKQAELERDLLSAAVEQSDSLVLITDLEGRALYANPAFEAITGYAREEVLGRDPRVLLGGEERAEKDRPMWEALRWGEAWRGEFENRRKDGIPFVTRANISPIHDFRGRVTHIVGISHDITAEKELEAQLRQMQKMETVGQLTGGIAHDMNNILSAVMSYTALARADLEPGQAGIARDLGEVETAARRGAELIRKLMTFSRRDHLRPRVLDAEKVVLGLEGMLSRILPANLKISMSTEGGGAWCRADEGALEQILVNLATNARDALSGPGELHIIVDTTRVETPPAGASHRPDPGFFVRIRVKDTGAGMTEAVRARLFEPFFTTKPVGKGTGLGMAVIHGLVAQHGGFLTVESAVGKGTTVGVHIPAAPEEAPEALAPAAAPLEPGGERILLVEDDPHLRTTAARLLTRAGYRVTALENGNQAAELLSTDSGTTDLVLTDLMLPGLNGKDLFLRAGGPGRCPAFLFTTGYAPEDLDMEGEGLRRVPFLPKPWEPSDLLRKVRFALDEDSGALEERTA